jgi:flagellar basal-body rod protein FlgC
MNLFGVMSISASALQAERVRAEVVAANMANSETTRTADGGPYQRHHVVFQAVDQGPFQNALNNYMESTGSASGQLSLQPMQAQNPSTFGSLPWNRGAGSATPGGVAVNGVTVDSSAPLERYEPGHPDANAQGFVAYPDINPLTEMVDLMGATRSYGMNASAVQAEKAMVSSSFEILK